MIKFVRLFVAMALSFLMFQPALGKSNIDELSLVMDVEKSLSFVCSNVGRGGAAGGNINCK